jgi:mRNA degradation ribonuclease J1/J2
MISLMFYGGAGEIGGNKILLESGGAKVYLDFGESFDFGEDYL